MLYRSLKTYFFRYFKTFSKANSEFVPKHYYSFQTQKTVFEARTEKRCDIHFKKECWIDYQEQAKTENIHICTTKPERKCNLTDQEKAKFDKTECNTYYETICQTRYTEKNVTEDRPVCQNVLQEMCDQNGNNCMRFTTKVILSAKKN